MTKEKKETKQVFINCCFCQKEITVERPLPITLCEDCYNILSGEGKKEYLQMINKAAKQYDEKKVS